MQRLEISGAVHTHTHIYIYIYVVRRRSVNGNVENHNVLMWYTERRKIDAERQRDPSNCSLLCAMCVSSLYEPCFYGYNGHWHVPFVHGEHLVVCQIRGEFEAHVLLKCKERRN
jgi:hypothetical protein